MVLESKVTSVNNDIESGNVIERVVSESDSVKVDNEIVSEKESVICCNEVVISVDELEKEWRKRVDECVGQRVNFPLICDEPSVKKCYYWRARDPY